jgi:hypothetical protein
MASLLVSGSVLFECLLSRLLLTWWTWYRQIYKIVAPYVILAVSFAVLNARLHLPPFSLFLVALTLTDGKCRFAFTLAGTTAGLNLIDTVMTMTFFFRVTDTGMFRVSPLLSYHRRI